MTKKDFQLIADAIATMPLAVDLADRRMRVKIIACHFAKVLRAAYPRFDEARFVDACMGETPQRKAKPVGTKSLERLLKF